MNAEQETGSAQPGEDHQVLNEKGEQYVIIAISTNLQGEVCIALFDKIPDSLSGNPFSHHQSRFRQFEWTLVTHGELDKHPIMSIRAKLLKQFSKKCPIRLVTELYGTVLYDTAPKSNQQLMKKREELPFFFKPKNAQFSDAKQEEIQCQAITPGCI